MADIRDTALKVIEKTISGFIYSYSRKQTSSTLHDLL